MNSSFTPADGLLGQLRLLRVSYAGAIAHLRLARPHKRNAANDELIALIARALRIPKRDVTIVAGERARSKRIRIAGIDREQALARLV